MTRVLEYSPSKKVIAIYFIIALAASIFSYLIFWLLISIILIWFICKQLFSTYLNRKERVTNSLQESAELMSKTPEERMKAILRGDTNDDEA